MVEISQYDTLLIPLLYYSVFEYYINEQILKGQNILVITNYLKPKSDKTYFVNGIFDFKSSKFSAKDIEKFELIFSLVKERGFTLEGAKKELNREKNGNLSVLKKLQKIRQELLRIKAEL